MPRTFPADGLILSPRAVARLTSLNATTIWRLRRRGTFPAPIQLSPGRVGYRRVEIEAWLDAREACHLHEGGMENSNAPAR